MLPDLLSMLTFATSGGTGCTLTPLRREEAQGSQRNLLLASSSKNTPDELQQAELSPGTLTSGDEHLAGGRNGAVFPSILSSPMAKGGTSLPRSRLQGPRLLPAGHRPRPSTPGRSIAGALRNAQVRKRPCNEVGRALAVWGSARCARWPGLQSGLARLRVGARVGAS